jgi:hypothetical protein
MSCISTSDNDFRKKFYEESNQYIALLNEKFREKAVIKQELNDKILCCLSNKHRHEFNSRFISWCLTTFVTEKIGMNTFLCDSKTKKLVLIFENMYDVYRQIHEETAHGGRDKCLDSLPLNYSRYNRQLLQIFINNCGPCQKRKSIEKPMLSKPIIALGKVYCILFIIFLRLQNKKKRD